FFRLGKLKKFYCHDKGGAREITFFDAVNRLQCRPETPREPVPGNYYRWLEDNKEAFKQDTSQEIEIERNPGGRSNIDYIERRLKDKYFKNCRKFTDSDEEFLENFHKMMTQGTIARKVAREIKKELENTLDPLEMINILRKHIRGAATLHHQPTQNSFKREVILSGYLLKK
ncbi:MAG: helicase, partial [Acidobacteria bacterium]|nr:helicase [Acidobacteriota bacterium]